MDGALFAELPSFLPSRFEGETLYSWGARFHRRSGNISARQSSLQLFGHRVASLRPDFPFGLDHFLQSTGTLFVGVEDILSSSTIFGLFERFIREATRTEAIERLRGSSSKGIQSTLGLLACRVGTTHPLKACKECMAFDILENQVAWWHLEHQWPSSLICLRHGAPLSSVLLPGEQSGRWMLPGDIPKDGWQELHNLSKRQFDVLVRLGEFTAQAAVCRTVPFESDLLRYVYLSGAHKHGLATMDGSLRYQDLRKKVLSEFSGLEEIDSLGFVASAKCEHGGFLGVLTRRYSGNRHPTKHLVLASTLFESFDSFEEAYKEVSSYAAEVDGNSISDKITETRLKLCHYIEVEKISVNCAAKALGISATQALRWINKCQISYQRRPRVLDAETEARLVLMLQTGIARDEISDALGIRKSFITSYLAGRPQLRMTWWKMDFDRRKANYRQQFLALIQQNRGVSLKELIARGSSGHQWLYRNDRQWLADHLDSLWSSSCSN
jgi:hypothetical protein